MIRYIFIFLLIGFLYSCQSNSQKVETVVKLETMGTFGVVKTITDYEIEKDSLKVTIDSILWDVNMATSTWIDSSVISESNRNGKLVKSFKEIYNLHFNLNLVKSLEIKETTNSYFNPFIKPLVDYYNVQGANIIGEIDTTIVDSLLNCIDNKDIGLINNSSCLKLDFSAIAKGYGVDVVAYYLDSLGIQNYMVEIGGEVHVKGKNIENEYWRLGIEEPNEAKREIFKIIELDNLSMATSGNYRNFKVLENGQKIVHIINPKTGYPEISNLLSATIITDNCMEADAYATACMVMGLDTCLQFIENQPKLECYLIYSDEEGNLKDTYSEGFESLLLE